VLTCLGPAPASDLLAAIDRCATAAGGADWPSLALTGLATVVVLAFAVLAVGAVVSSWKS
jgi:hypothetical protein